LLEQLRRRASKIINIFDQPALLYGSVARGDVHTESDIDIVFLSPVETYMLEMPLEANKVNVIRRELVQANPNSVPKAHFHLEENTTFTVPLFKPSENEEEFYRFGGAVGISELKAGKRVSGVTKKLLFIDPIEKGHIEYSILGREVEVSRKLGLSLDTVMERVRVLSRRDKIGRTGVYLKEQIDEDTSFEATWKYLADRDPILRRHWKIRKR
jgi:predicted nucleotidyltransferase